MNDPTELHTGHEAVQQAVARAKLNRKIADGIQEHLTFCRSVMERGRTFVFSASKDGDSLAQWRAYADDLSGYAIGFHSAEPFNLIEHLPFDAASDPDGHGDINQYVSVWRDVVYDLRDQASESDAFIGLLARLVDATGCGPAPHRFADLLVRAYAPAAYAGIVARLKHSKYFSEDEVRITATALDAARFHSHIPSGRAHVDLTGWIRPASVAGMSTFASPTSASLPIYAVRRGPMCPTDDLRQLLDRLGYTSVEAFTSEIPYQ